MATFSIPLAQLAEKMKADLDTVVRKATLEVFASVVRKSPVRTGRFRANWNVSAGAPNAATTQSVDSARATVEVTKALSLPVGGVTYIANGLPYAARLEHGYSKQAPAGMVKLSALEFEQFVQRAIAK